MILLFAELGLGLAEGGLAEGAGRNQCYRSCGTDDFWKCSRNQSSWRHESFSNTTRSMTGACKHPCRDNADKENRRIRFRKPIPRGTHSSGGLVV